MKNWSRFVTGSLILGVLVAVFEGDNLKRHIVVRTGVLHRLGQPSESGLRLLNWRYNIRSILTAQLYDIQLREHSFDIGAPSGERESQFAADLGAAHLQFPMGEESYWPWPTPWQMEEFLQVMDNPANYPVLVHCAGGRHRTGTYGALFRLEYDGWTAEQALMEMYQLDFGYPQTIQDHQLRTYSRRPRPNFAEWTALCKTFPAVQGETVQTFERYAFRWKSMLDQAIRERDQTAHCVTALNNHLTADAPFAIELGAWLIQDAMHPCLPRVVALANQAVANPRASERTWAAAAAIIADFGEPADQEKLLALLDEGQRQGAPSARYAALVRGVTNRFTRNRIAFLQPLLQDARHRPEASARHFRYCDTATATLGIILNIRLDRKPGVASSDWDQGRQAALAWFAEHAPEVTLAKRIPPAGNNQVRPGNPATAEDLSRARF